MLMAQEPSSVIDFLKSIPDYVWILLGILIAGVLPWIGIYVQLRHDSKERRTSLLRDIYLSVAEKIGLYIHYLNNFYTGYLDQPQGYKEAISKLNILGTGETITVVNTFNDYLIKAMLLLIPLQERIELLNRENQICYNFAQKASQGMDKAINKMEEYNSQGVIDKTKWTYVEADLEFAKNERIALMEKYKITSNEIIKLTCELAEKCHQIAQEAEELEIPIIKAIRKELSFPFDERAYREMLHISNIKWDENTQEYIASKKELSKEIVNKFTSTKEPPEAQS